MKSLISNLWTNHKEAILACGVVLLLIGVIGSLSFYAGSNYTELKYLEKEEKYELSLKKLIEENEVLKENHRVQSDKNKQILNELSTQHKVNIATLNAEYGLRLREYEDRVRIYSSKANCTNGSTTLGDVTTRLDSALTRGLHLVERMSSTLKLRDEQVKVLVNQIKTDRQLTE